MPTALVSLSLPYSSRTMIASAPHGRASLSVFVTEPPTVNTAAGHPPYAPASLHVTRAGYSAVTLPVRIVDGSPAMVMTVKNGLSIVAPKSRPIPGKPGQDLFEKYHAVTSGKQVVATKGTRLDIIYNAGAKKTTVTVVEGHVQVTNDGASVLVGASQATVVAAAKAPTTPRQVDLSAVIAWVQRVPAGTASVVPPVLTIPLPHYVPVPPPPPAQAPTMYVSSALTSTTWSGVVSLQGIANDVFADGETDGIYIDPGSRSLISNCLIGGIAGPAIIAPAEELTAIANITYGSGQQGITLSGGNLAVSGTWQRQEVPIKYIGFVNSANGTVTNSVLSDGLSYGILINDGSLPTIRNCTIERIQGTGISLPKADLSHVTGNHFIAVQHTVQTR